MKNTNKVPNFMVIVPKLRRDTARMAATEAQKFFRNSFVNGGFTDKIFSKWKPAKNPLSGKKVMYRRGSLMASVRKMEETEQRVVVGTDSVYGDIHNEGGTITVTEQMKKFWWAKYYEFAGKVKVTKSGRVSKTKANNTINAKAQYCKNMALMPVGSKIKMPQRKFLGESATMMKQFDNWYKKQVEIRFKNNLKTD